MVVQKYTIRISKLLKFVLDKIDCQYNHKTFENEDKLIMDFISQKLKYGSKSWLEVASGDGRFIKKISNLFPATDITGIDINPILASSVKKKGFNVVCGDILNKHFTDKFDIVHASHIIEHFQYKEAIKLLDKCLSLLKIRGSLIIRSPLLYPGFFDDISHIRPYPPNAVINYFFLKQQSKVSKYNIIQTHLCYRYQSININNPNILSFFLNTLFKSLYNLGIKSFKPNGYVLIVKKIS